MATTTTTTTMEAPAPTAVPDVKVLRDAIPAKCFERSMVRSFSYVARDLVAVSCLFYAAVKLVQLDLPLALAVPAWALYSFIQGCFFTGLWILAHECGHDSFSDDLTVNAATGWALHSMLMVPFFSWKFSHSRHHRYANHMEKDTVFVPTRKHELAAKPTPSLFEKLVDHTLADSPLLSLASLVVHQLFGWPMYIFLNAGAGVKSLIKNNRKNSTRWKQSHLDPTSDVFTQAEMPFVALSNVGLLILFSALYQVSKSLGVMNTCLLYGLPYLWMNHWIGEYEESRDSVL